jgi:transposase
MNLNKAIRQVVEKGYYVPDVFRRLGISDKSLYYWVRRLKWLLGYCQVTEIG